MWDHPTLAGFTETPPEKGALWAKGHPPTDPGFEAQIPDPHAPPQPEAGTLPT